MSTLDRHDFGDTEIEDFDELSTSAPRDRGYGIFYVVAAVLGLISSFVITVDKIKLLEDPNFVPSCSINPIISCGSIMKSEQSHLFGFPNPLIGLVAFGVLLTLGVLLSTGTKLARWTWLGMALGVSAGMAFVVWLISQALYSIGALCPYCMVVWSVMIPAFVLTWARFLKGGGERSRSVAAYLPIVIAVGYAVLALLVFLRFESFWVSLL